MANLRTNNLSGEQGQNAYRGSVFFDGNYSFLSLGSGVISPFGTNDFTIEFWINQGVNTSNYTVIFNLHTTNAKGFEVVFHSGTIQIYTDTGAWRDTGYAPKSGVYEHIAFVRNYSGNTLKMYANGEEKYSVSNNVDYDSTNTYVNIGSYNISSYGHLQGYISNFRITDGSALYTTNYFTPPTTELTADANTVLLCCQNSDDPTQEATGKTITGFGNLQESDDTELVTNSGFTTDISGWTASGVQWSHSSGALMHFGNGNTQRNIFQDVTTVIGNRYVFRVEASSAEADTAYWQVIGSSDLAGNNFIADNNNAAPIEHVFYFTADSTTTKIRFYSYDSSNSSNVRSYWYKASLKLAPQGKQPEVIPPFGVDAGNTFGGPIQQSTEGYMYFPTGRTEERGRGRAIWGGGQNPNNKVVLDYFQIQTGGITIDFGNLSDARNEVRACGSSTRGVWAGGRDPSVTNIIDFVEITTTANAVDFGDLTVARAAVAAVSNQTRGCFMAGFTSPNTNHIDFITIATTGNATDFGDTLGNYQAQGRAMSPTRGLAAGNYGASNLIEFITIATTGNSTDFGDRTIAAFSLSGTSDNTRGVFTGGQNPSASNVIDFVTMASAGNATDFGDLVTANGSSHADTSDSIIGCIAGGVSNTNAIEKIIIQTTGNAVDYGDLTSGRSQLGATSDSHGGLS